MLLHQHYIDSLSEALYTFTHLLLNNSPLFEQIIKDFEVQHLSQSIHNLNQLVINFLTMIHYCLAD